jgi:outer membrane autotransporter protein
MALDCDGDLAVVLGQLDSALQTSGDPAYFDQPGGEVFGTTASVGIEIASRFLGTISRRLRTMGGFENAGGPATTAHGSRALPDLADAELRGQSPSRLFQSVGSCWRPWVQGYGVAANAQGDGNASGFGYGTGGTVVAVDRPIDRCTRLGFVGGYSAGQLYLDDPSQRMFVDGGQLAVYMMRRDCHRYLTGIFSCAYNSYDSARRLDFGELARTASAAYHGNEYSFYLETGQMFRAGALQFQPYGALQYINLYQTSFSEHGAGSMNLAVESSRAESFCGLIGSRLVWYDRSVCGRVLAPEFRALWRHDFLDGDRPVAARFAATPGSSFVVHGADLGRDAAILGGALNVYFGDCLSMFASYDVLANDTEVAHVGTGGLQVLW